VAAADGSDTVWAHRSSRAASMRATRTASEGSTRSGNASGSNRCRWRGPARLVRFGCWIRGECRI
jgi:hypothetical protein